MKPRARITELNLRDVRCFDGEQLARLGRITLLVGENGTGKSTFLGCYSAFATLANMIGLGGENNFDKTPFRMGGFDTIARSGKSEFAVSGRFENHIHTAARFSFVQREKDDRPFERETDFEFDDARGTAKCINISSDETGKSLRFRGPNFVFDLDWSEISYITASRWLSQNIKRGFLPYRGDAETFEKRKNSVSHEEMEEFGKFINFFRSEMPLTDRLYFPVEALESQLPPRKRKYASVPFHLEDAEVNTRIGKIGNKLGLFKEVSVRKLKFPEDGWEVLINIDGEIYNLVDVAYGIHSLLPLLGAMCKAESEKIFLLQEPEIHVHPSAQARLAQHMAEGNHDFIIETHSDHLIDRFRICIMQGVLQPEELSIVYFEQNKDRNGVQIYSIRVDKNGNLLNVPDNYRLFFLRETERLLGFED